VVRARGKVVKLKPMQSTLKALGSKPLKLKCDELLSRFAFKFNLRRYNVAATEARLMQLSMEKDALEGWAEYRVTRYDPRYDISIWWMTISIWSSTISMWNTA
jgi:hypothetical protein